MPSTTANSESPSWPWTMIRSIGPNSCGRAVWASSAISSSVRIESGACRPSSSASTLQRRLVARGQLGADLEVIGVVAVACLQQRDARRLVEVRLEQAHRARDGLVARVVHQPAARAPSRRRGSSSRGTGCRPSRTARPGRRAASAAARARAARASGRAVPGGARARTGAPRGGRSASSGNASGVWRSTARSASRKTRCQVSCACATFGPASAIACCRSSWWTCRNCSVARRLASRFSADTGPARGRPRVTMLRSSQTPRQPSTLTRARSSAKAGEVSNASRSAGVEQVAEVVLDRLDDPERGQELEVEPDAHEPAGIGEVAALVDDVADQRARVELGLVRADQQHREPRVVGVREPGRLARGVGLDHAARRSARRASPAARRHRPRARSSAVATVAPSRVSRTSSVEALREQRRERVLAGQVAQRDHVRAVGVQRRLAQAPVLGEHRGRDRAPVDDELAAGGVGDREQQVVHALAERDRIAAAHARVARLVGRAPPGGEGDDPRARHLRATLPHRALQ